MSERLGILSRELETLAEGPGSAEVQDEGEDLHLGTGADPADWSDAAGRRWTVRRESGELAAWTLWEGGEPRLWWGRQPRGGILSHRDGSQFRAPDGAGAARPRRPPPPRVAGGLPALRLRVLTAGRRQRRPRRT